MAPSGFHFNTVNCRHKFMLAYLRRKAIHTDECQRVTLRRTYPASPVMAFASAARMAHVALKHVQRHILSQPSYAIQMAAAHTLRSHTHTYTHTRTHKFTHTHTHAPSFPMMKRAVLYAHTPFVCSFMHTSSLRRARKTQKSMMICSYLFSMFSCLWL